MTAVVQNMAIADLIPLNYKELGLKIELVTPSVETREYKKEAELNKLYMEMGIKSPQTIAGEIGLNYEREQENFAALRERQQEKETKL
jgi:Tat protein secretion system quality control protein TatD with DNase activity